jgi:hypothetical protein
MPTQRISETRNDFKLAYLLARYPFSTVKRVGPWTLWREILSYKSFSADKRVMIFVTVELIKSPRTRAKARPFLKEVAKRLRNIDTSVLSEEELLIRLKGKTHK